MSFKIRVLLSSTVLLYLASGVVAQCSGDVKLIYVDSRLSSLSSKNYLRKYRSNLTCRWLLITPNDFYRIRMNIGLELGNSSRCNNHLTVYYGRNTRASRLRLCNGEHEVWSTGRYLSLVFQSDGTIEGRGFRFIFMAVRIPSIIIHRAVTTTEDSDITTEEHQKRRKKEGINTGVLVGGIAGGVCFIVIFSLCCGRCMGRKEPRQPPEHRAAAFYHSHAPCTGTPVHVPRGDLSSTSAAVMVQNNNSVFMVPLAFGRHVNSFSPRYASQINAGMTNMGFDEGGEDGARLAAAGFLGPPAPGEPPPSYCASMLVTHPPKVLPRVPPSSRRHPHVSTGNRSGLSPPPLFAPRDSALNPITEQSDLEEDQYTHRVAAGSILLPYPSLAQIDPPENQNEPGRSASVSQPSVVNGSGFPTAWPGPFLGRSQTPSVTAEGRPSAAGTIITQALGEPAPELTTSPAFVSDVESQSSTVHHSLVNKINSPTPNTNSPAPETGRPAVHNNSPARDANSAAP